eukprot:gnl/MRDRNA2_/MRDRNA2_90960_c0_seq1.p1 gnl/MRDRNA2_/MRDRNA2_90960_c0~~gnl/MRDRNA2_/MRDRNA2_90960_c0_seq1.p1  ORF type:complete len:296 (-),score=40.22 gnl/MRDRNA2_/MRDRNA2_90960_c0_seq1:109-996(-)
MGAAQACTSVQKAQSCTLIKSCRPDALICTGSEASPTIKSKAASPISLWAKCKDAVHEFRSFQKFLMKRYSGPGDAFDFLSEGCKGSPRGCIGREDFTRLVKKAGFKGDCSLVFAMLKAGDDFITRDSFKQRLKARPNKKGDDFAAVVGQAVAFAALEKGVSGSCLEKLSKDWRRGRSQPRQRKTEKANIPRGHSKNSLSSECATASSRPKKEDKSDLPRGRSKDSLNTESTAASSRPSSKGPKRTKKRWSSPSPSGDKRSSARRSPDPHSERRQSSKSPEPSKRGKSLHRQKSK